MFGNFVDSRLCMSFFFLCLFHNSVLNNPAASYASYRKVYADLGIPEPPKKPANAYVRFLTDKLDGLSLNIAQRKEKFKEGGLLWKKLDQNTRDQYLNNFSSEQVSYGVLE